MGTFEKNAMFLMLSICIGLFVGGVAAIIAMIIEVWAADARRVKRWFRSFLGERKEART